LKNPDAGIGLIEEARVILERNHDRRVVYATTALAMIARDRGRWADARNFADDALAHAGSDLDDTQLATLRWVLARALVKTGETSSARIRSRLQHANRS